MALDDAHEAVHVQHDKFADERWIAHDERHAAEKDLSGERWKAHDDKHDSIAHNLAEYKVQSNEWRASLSDLRATFAPVSRIEAAEKQIDSVREELRQMIATEREERRDQQNLRAGTRQGMSQTVTIALASVGALATILSIVAILASLLRSSFANPVDGIIHPAVWARPAGNRDFEVTSPFGPRILIIAGVKKASVHKGLDIGNGRAGDNVKAQGGGTVVEYRPNSDGVVTIQVGNWRLVAAHMTGIPVRIGQQVNAGQVIGQVGSVGAEAAHLHFENLELVGGKYIPRDPWGLLAQNGTLPDSGTGDDVRLKGTLIQWLDHRLATVTSDTGAAVVADPTAMPYVNLRPPSPYPKGSILTPNVLVKGNTLVGSDQWYGAWFATDPPVFGYVPVNQCTLAIVP